MPGTQIALIRGINVGRAKRIAMSELRALVEELGYGNVRSLLNSGNIVFTTPRAAPGNAPARIEESIRERLGVSARVTVLSAAELAAAVNDNPLCKIADNPSRLLVAVLNKPTDRAKLAALLKQDWKREVIAVGERVAYLWCADGILASSLLQSVARTLGDGVTSRNWATMLKLHAMANDQKT